MVDKLKVRFLTAIWGARYIKEFARVSLPSYLAAGNLPYLAAESNLEIVVLTSRDSVPQFDSEPNFEKVRALCPLKFIFIDDLIGSGNYGVTLTLAYARGIMSSGAEQTETSFVFMNSDFVLADGAMRTLLAKLREGHNCIMAPSLRAGAEATLPILVDAVDEASQTLTMSPRRMVQLALDNLHPTVIGKTVTQNVITCDTHNQIYWQVDDTTLLARHYLIFMLAIKPERPLRAVNSYCDYGLVPELVPSGRFEVLGDSDAFFMLELQPAAQEREYLRAGASTPTEIAQSLAVWTTREHRRFAEVDVIFHAGDLPAGLDRYRDEATRYVTKLRRRMPSRPVDHVDHRYWKLGVQSWTLLKYGNIPDPQQLPPELTIDGNENRWLLRRRRRPLLERTNKHLTDAYLTFVNRMRLAAGIVPNVPIWNYLWLDSQLIIDWANAVKSQPHARNLLLCKTLSPLRTSMPRLVSFEDCLEPAALAGHVKPLRNDSETESTERYDNIFLHLPKNELHKAKPIIDRAVGVLKPGGTLVFHVWLENSEFEPGSMGNELAFEITKLLPASWLGYRVEAKFVGGLTKRRLRKAERRLFRYLIPSSLATLPHFIVALATWPIIAGFTVVNNIRMRYTSVYSPAYCTSVLLMLTKQSKPPAAGDPGPSL